MDSCRLLVLKLQLVSVLLLFYANHGWSMKCNDNQQNMFVTNPVDMTVKEGENSTFTCAVSNVKDTDRIIWRVNPSQYHSVIRNSFNESTNHMVSKITVYNVGRIAQSNQCVLYIVNSDLTMSPCYSLIAHLYIQYFPTSDELECGSNSNNPLQHGEIIQTWCAVSMGNPRVELQWLTEEQNNLNQTLKEDNGRLTLTQEIEVTPALHEKPIMCIAKSPAVFPNQQRSCIIGSFAVLHRPQVSVTPAEATLRVEQNNSIEIICQADAYPAVTYFSWACLPVHTVEGCQSSNRSIIITTSKRARAISENKTIVFAICKAGNIMGNSSSSTQITILNTQFNEDITNENHTNVTEADGTRQMLSVDSLLTSSDRTSVPSSAEDVNIVDDSLPVKVNADDSWHNTKQPHNVYIISVLSVMAGILVSAGLFAVITIVLYRHFKDVTTQIATHVQCQHDQSRHTLESLHPEVHPAFADKDAQSSHIYEETGFLKNSEGHYGVTQTLCNSCTFKEYSDSSDGSSMSSLYKSSSSIESSKDDGSYNSTSFDNGHNRNEVKDLYGNQLVIQMQARSSNKIHSPHSKGLQQNCNTFPEPPPLPLLK